jgi:hypothetical protein
MSETILTRGQSLYDEARQVVADELKLREQSGYNLVRLAAILKDLYAVFLERTDPREALVLVPRTKGFADFRECMVELLRPLDLGERMGWYYLSVGRLLLGAIPEADLNAMGFEKAKQLARVAKAQKDIPAELIERAKDTEIPATRIRDEVNVMLYRGLPDHSEGPRRSLVLVAGKEVIDSIEEKVERLRPAVTEAGATAPASDAQVVDFALADCLAGVQEEEDHAVQILRHGRG